MSDPSDELPRPEEEGAGGRVVGVDRVLVVLKALAASPEGASLDDLARNVGAAKPTIHRALAALRRAGFAHQLDGGRYCLGDEFLRLAFAFHEARPDTVHVQPILRHLSDRFGEAAHYAVLVGRDVVYRAKVIPAAGGIQLTSAVGGRNPAHATAVGKLLLALALPDDDAVRRWAGEVPLARRTPNTITDPDDLTAELQRIRARGWSSEDEECETGVCCVAVPYQRRSPANAIGAISVSAIIHRTSLDQLVKQVDDILEIVSGPGRC